MNRLIMRHAGRPAFILGGADSLSEDLKHCPPEAVIISASGEGSKLSNIDYVVSIDAFDMMQETVSRISAPFINPDPRADYVCINRMHGYSGLEAVRCAWVMGCAPIILGGFDLYSKIIRGKMDKQIRKWKRLADMFPSATIRPVSGPLVEVFRQYDPDETPPLPDKSRIIEALSGGIA